MDKWVWNLIGLAIVVFIFTMTWRIFGGSDAEVSAAGISAKIASPPLPVTKSPLPIEDPGPSSCRLPEHGIERWETQIEKVDSGWRRGGSSPAEFCAAQQTAMRELFKDSEIFLASTGEKHKSEYTPFKHDFYLYSCEFQILNPIYHLAPNRKCG